MRYLYRHCHLLLHNLVGHHNHRRHLSLYLLYQLNLLNFQKDHYHQVPSRLRHRHLNHLLVYLKVMDLDLRHRRRQRMLQMNLKLGKSIFLKFIINFTTTHPMELLEMMIVDK